jgi:hypothetical protein
VRYLMIACVLLCVVLVAACNPSGGANSARVVTGTITVANNSYWPLVKIGVFSGPSTGGALGSNPITNGYATFSDVYSYRIAYKVSANDGSVYAIPQVSGSTFSISDKSTTSSAFSFELPSTVPQFVTTPSTDYECYYWAAWYDGNADSKLDLVDSSSSGAGAEFNRCATKATKDLSNVPTTIAIEYFRQSQDLSSNPTGNYKYVGYNGASYNEQNELPGYNTGFTFNVSNTAGW